jgi:hypothetical protein
LQFLNFDCWLSLGRAQADLERALRQHADLTNLKSPFDIIN